MTGVDVGAAGPGVDAGHMQAHPTGRQAICGSGAKPAPSLRGCRRSATDAGRTGAQRLSPSAVILGTGMSQNERNGHLCFGSRRKREPVRVRLCPYLVLRATSTRRNAGQSGPMGEIGSDRKPATGSRPILSIGYDYGTFRRELSTLSWETAAGRRGCRAPSADPLARKPAQHARLDGSSCSSRSRSPWPVAARPLG